MSDVASIQYAVLRHALTIPVSGCLRRYTTPLPRRPSNLTAQSGTTAPSDWQNPSKKHPARAVTRMSDDQSHEGAEVTRRGSWPISMSVDEDVLARLQAVRDSEPTLSVDEFSINGRTHRIGR